MRRAHIAALIASLVTAACLTTARPAHAAGPFTAWYMRGAERIPVMMFADAEACARAAETLAAKSETQAGCVEGLLPDPEPLKPELPDTPQPSASARPQRQTRPNVNCSITGTEFGLTAVCKSF